MEWGRGGESYVRIFLLIGILDEVNLCLPIDALFRTIHQLVARPSGYPSIPEQKRLIWSGTCGKICDLAGSQSSVSSLLLREKMNIPVFEAATDLTSAIRKQPLRNNLGAC